MEYLNRKLFLEYREIVPHVMISTVYDQLKSEGSINICDPGGDGRKVLVAFDTLPDKYKAKVYETYDDPYMYAVEQLMLNSLVWDTKGHGFYTEYILPTGDKLPCNRREVNGKPAINYVHRYTKTATWLNMLVKLTTDKVALKRELNLSIMGFWGIAASLVKTKKVNLPADKAGRRLKDKVRKWRDHLRSEVAYRSLIEVHKFGNGFSKKVKDEKAEAFLKALVAHRDKYDDAVIADKYNSWAMETGRETITAAAVGYWRKKLIPLSVPKHDGMVRLDAEAPRQENVFKNGPVCLYMLDYRTKQYYYVGENAGEVIRIPPEPFMEGGVPFCRQQMHEDDLKILLGISLKKLVHLTDIQKDRDKYWYSINYRVRNLEGETIHVLQQFRVMEVDESGHPLVVTGYVINITPIKHDNTMVDTISTWDESRGWCYLRKDVYFPGDEGNRLSKREIEILKHMLEGLSSKRIADKLHVSIHTVNKHRSNMLKKASAKNTADLLKYAFERGII